MKRELDHCGVAVKSLDRGRDAYARLGFQLTARSFHSGSRTKGGPVEPWGSGNHCAMFRDGYLEIIGLTDASMYSTVKDMVATYEGLHIVAIGSGEADAAYAEFQEAGAPVEAPRALERDAADGGAQARKLANLHPLLHDNGRIAQYAARRRADARGRRVRHPVWHLVTLAGRLPLYQHRACELIRAKEEGASGSGTRSGGGHAGVEVAVAAGRAKTEW